MTMQARLYMPAFIAFSSFVFGATLLAHEHFNSGVQSHHLLDRPDLPAISNWFGLIVLPLLGWLLGIRLRNHLILSTAHRLSIGNVAGLGCALLYGAAMATSFKLGQPAMTSSLFFGLFLLAAALPIYRIECIFGFVVGMTLAFGTVLPTLVAVGFAAISVVIHFVVRTAMSVLRRSRRRAQQ